jgi:hypothetical protein
MSAPADLPNDPAATPPLQPVSASPKAAMVHIRKQSEQLFFVYTGIARALMVNATQFLSQTRLMLRNVVIFQDATRSCYLRGVSPELDSFEALLAWQIAFRDSQPHVRRVYCVGTSMGGYAALLFGHMLGAEAVWAFGPPTVPSRDAAGFVAVPDEVPPERADLAVLLGRPNGRTKYHVYYNERFAADSAAAAHIAHCEGVSLWPQPGDGHNVVGGLLERNVLRNVFPPVS